MSSATETAANGNAPTWGDLVEDWVGDAFGLEYVDESYYDFLDDDGTKVETKGAQVWINNGYRNGKQQRTRGRFKFWSGSHDELVAEDGDYILVVYEEDDDGDINVLAVQRVKAATVTEFVGGCWYDVRSNPRVASKGDPYRLSWSKVFPLSEVEG